MRNGRYLSKKQHFIVSDIKCMTKNKEAKMVTIKTGRIIGTSVHGRLVEIIRGYDLEDCYKQMEEMGIPLGNERIVNEKGKVKVAGYGLVTEIE